MRSQRLLYFLPLAALFLAATTHPKPALAAHPLSTDSRWIVEESGRRVKLACVNWVSHLEAVVSEGLSKQPMDVISKKIVELGFNCVRFTWPLYLATNESLANLTVRQSFQSLGLDESISGFQANNPSLIDLSLINAYQEVVSNMGQNNVMVILDNHLSKPGWCCSNFDGNGFFGDQYFNPDLWIKGLTKMATMFNGSANVVGMSLRNELRGPKQNANDWYKYMQKGAEAVHAANPNVLVILSGLNYDKDFSFLLKRPLNVSFTGKVVFELHWYAFTDGSSWKTGNPNQVCGQVVGNIMRKAGFLLDQGYPLFVSEFGIDLRGTNVNDNRYFNCFLGWAAEYDLDWALWTLQGSYYLRENVVGMEEFYGIYNWNWCETRNSSFLEIMTSIQSPFQGPGLSDAKPHQLIYHPYTGLCVQRKSLLEPLKLGPCSDSDSWSYTEDNTLTVKGTLYCLQADDLGKPAKLGIICSGASSRWEKISDSKMHLSAKLDKKTSVCLDVELDSKTLITSSCKCLSRDNMCDPGSQWFKIINSTVRGEKSNYSPFRRVKMALDFMGTNMLGSLMDLS